MDKQIYLIKVGKFSYADVDTMPIYELNWYYSRLVELLEEANSEDQSGTGKK